MVGKCGIMNKGERKKDLVYRIVGNILCALPDVISFPDILSVLTLQVQQKTFKSFLLTAQNGVKGAKLPRNLTKCTGLNSEERSGK